MWMLTLPTKILAVSNTSTKTEGSVVAEVKVARSNLAVGTLFSHERRDPTTLTIIQLADPGDLKLCTREVHAIGPIER